MAHTSSRRVEPTPTSGSEDALTALGRVKTALIEDRDKATLALAKGGTILEMEALTQAWRVIDAGIRGIEKAANLCHEHQECPNGDPQVTADDH